MDERNDYNSIPEEGGGKYILPPEWARLQFGLVLPFAGAKKNDILTLDTGCRLKVLSIPRRKWWHKLLQRLTFGWYKAYPNFRVKILDNEE